LTSQTVPCAFAPESSAHKESSTHKNDKPAGVEWRAASIREMISLSMPVRLNTLQEGFSGVKPARAISAG
jgi:hypothetical protein